MSYYIFKKGVPDKYLEKLKMNDKFNHILSKIKNMSLASLTVLISIPFTPAFLVNIAAGISKIETRKFFIALLIGKISLVYFCGYVGVNIVEAFTNPYVLIKIVVAVALVFILSKILSKKFNI